MDYYSLVKMIHVSAAVLSLLGFCLRGVWMLNENSLLEAKAARVLPHIVDTVLLVSAIVLVVMLQAYPFQVSWLTAKVLLLVVYIVTGTIALKRGKSKQVRFYAFVLSIVVVLAIFAIALTKPIFLTLNL